MNIDFDQLPPDARVWVYASNRPLTEEEQQIILAEATAFTDGWTAHQVPLKASFRIVNGIFLLFGVDVGHHEVSGCGIDKSVHLVQKWEKELGLSLFNRMQLEYEQDGIIHLLAGKARLAALLAEGTINDDTLFFDKTVSTVAQLAGSFRIPLRKSWVYPQLVRQNG